MKLIIKKSYDSLSESAARKIASYSGGSIGDINICLPTGTTPAGMYKYLIHLYKEGKTDFSNINWFTLDEYIGLPLISPFSCYQQLKNQFYDLAGIKRDRIFTFNSEAADLNAEAERYESLIKKMGGLDLAVLGIGMNGHVGFNEPGSSENTRTRVVQLHGGTLTQSKKYFGNNEEIPTRGITLGLTTLLRSKSVLILANGIEKANIVHAALREPISNEVPVSHFQVHPSTNIMIDELAAGKL